MGLLDTSIETIQAHESEMGEQYVDHWSENHIPKNGKMFKIDHEIMRNAFNLKIVTTKHLNPSKKEEEKDAVFTTVVFKYGGDDRRCVAMDAFRPVGEGYCKAALWDKEKNKIVFTPDQGHRYIISDITDGDLDLFELGTNGGKGAVLYCYNCTKNITSKSDKWRFVFMNWDSEKKSF